MDNQKHTHIIFERTELPKGAYCGMCHNSEFCVSTIHICNGLSKECLYKPSQFKPREGYKHNRDCYFFSPENEYGPHICVFTGEFSFNCLGCDNYINIREANRALKKYIKERGNNIMDTNTKELEDKNEQMNRQIAHYDDELAAAKQCIDDIFRANGARGNNHINDEEFKLRVNDILKEYYSNRNRLCGYSDEHVIGLIEGPNCEVEDLYFSDEAKSLEIRRMEEYV